MNFIVKTFDQLSAGELYEILKSRAEIFILEQDINYQDMDDIDYKSLHMFFEENGRVTAYLRAFYKDESRETVQVGRVLTLEHGKGLGKNLMEKGLETIRRTMECKKICMDAQKYASGFYEKLGFRVTSGEFWEEGILHVRMELEL